MDMVNIKINGVDMQVPANYTILQAAKDAGITKVAVYVKAADSDVLKANENELANIFITSQAYITEEKPTDVLNEYTEEGYTVWVTKAEGEKCERCWKYRKLNSDGICEECKQAI